MDYDQVFCATLRTSSLRSLAAVAAKFGLSMRRWDFVAAYLQGELQPDEVVYCYAPPGHATLGKDGRPRICRVERPIYGMAQAGRRWQRTIFPWLIAHGLAATDGDPCVFEQRRTVQTPAGPRDEMLFVGCYVDDLFILYSHDDEHSLYHQFSTSLQADWAVEDEGPVSDLLNVEITQTGDSVVLTQTAYIDKLVDTYMPGGVPTRFRRNGGPCSEALPKLIHEATLNKLAPDPVILAEYQSIVGAELYASTHTRPDVSYAVGQLSRAMAYPTEELLEAARRVLAYLHYTRELGLTYEADNQPLRGFSDPTGPFVTRPADGYSLSPRQPSLGVRRSRSPSPYRHVRRRSSLRRSRCECWVYPASCCLIPFAS